MRIIQEADACTEPCQAGALLCRGGIYSSYLSDWRRELQAGQEQELATKKRGRPGDEEGQWFALDMLPTSWQGARSPAMVTP